MIWLVLVAALLFAVIWIVVEVKPTNAGPWKPELERLASFDRDGDEITIRNFRRARYSDRAKVEALNWTERNVKLSELRDVWFGLSVFKEPGLAHTFLSFDFGDGDPVVVSVESRQRPEQAYHPLAGLFHRYTLIYVVGDERDIIGVRIYSRRNQVHFQPLALSPARREALFLDMMMRTNELVERPRFYNTLTSNCTTSLLKDTAVPLWQRYLDWRLLLPGYSDRVAYDYEILDTSRTCQALRQASLMEGAGLDPAAEDFSDRLRQTFKDQLSANA